MRRSIGRLACVAVVLTACGTGALGTGALGVTRADAAAIPIPCSDLFGEDVLGVIVFTSGGTPNVFTCRGGIFGNPPSGSTVNIACSDFFGPDVQGRIIFTAGKVSVFTCFGGPFGTAPTVFE
jgi:hypothetical protein